jgi:hypothetical protein
MMPTRTHPPGEAHETADAFLGVWLAAAVILFAGVATAFVLALAAGGMSEVLGALGGIRGTWVPYVGVTVLAEVALPAVGWGFFGSRPSPPAPDPDREVELEMREVDRAYLDGRIDRQEYLVLLREFGRFP